MAPPTQATAIISASGSNFLFSPWESEFLVSSEDFRSPAAHDVTQGPGFGWSLATVINWNHEPVDSAGQAELESELDRHISDFVARGDDVWTEDFLNVIIVSMRNTTDQIPKKYKSSVVFSTQHSLPDGPYAFHSSSGRISRVTRLVDDTHNAFVGTCDSEKSFTTGLPILDSFRWLKCEGKIAIPPRAFQSSTQGVPESSLGLRFAVKDLIDVSGLETSCGNQAWRAHYPPKDKSATCIENLLSNGAVLLGKTKLTQFADGQDPSEWYDYQPPLNPRGDMFQKPSSSSTGSAVACAAYPWLDFVGTPFDLWDASRSRVIRDVIRVLFPHFV